MFLWNLPALTAEQKSLITDWMQQLFIRENNGKYYAERVLTFSASFVLVSLFNMMKYSFKCWLCSTYMNNKRSLNR